MTSRKVLISKLLLVHHTVLRSCFLSSETKRNNSWRYNGYWYLYHYLFDSDSNFMMFMTDMTMKTAFNMALFMFLVTMTMGFLVLGPYNGTYTCVLEHPILS
jgi:hypothetical protein